MLLGPQGSGFRVSGLGVRSSPVSIPRNQVTLQHFLWGYGGILGVYRDILGIFWDNGKENGNYYHIRCSSLS